MNNPPEIIFNPELLVESVESGILVPEELVGIKNNIKNNIKITKHCRTCQKELPVNKFSKAARNSDGLKTACKKCDKLNNKNYYSGHREDKIERSKNWNLKNGQKYFQNQLKYRLERQD